MKKQSLAPLAPIAATLFLAACETTTVGPPPAPPPPPPPNQVYIQTPYNPADYAWSQGIGRNAIRGYSPKGYSCAGSVVALTPDAPYSRERIAKLYGSVTRADKPVDAVRSIVIANDNRGLAGFVRVARCDANGQFAFDGLPDGSWFLIVQVQASPGPLALMRHVGPLTNGRVEQVPLTIRPQRP